MSVASRLQSASAAARNTQRRGPRPAAAINPKQAVGAWKPLEPPLSKGIAVERSLSVLLPVENVQSTLADAVHELLDILPELTPRFELIIIDDGSNDATAEVADELSSRYPQVYRVSHARRLGRSEAIRTGLRRATGDVIFLRDENCCLAIDEIQKLWRAVDDHPLVLGSSSGLIHRAHHLGGWRRRAEDGHFRMVNRHAMSAVRPSLDDQTRLVASDARRTHQWHEVELSRRHDPRPTRGFAAGSGGSRLSAQTASGSPGGGYLRRLKDFALGE